MRLLVITHAYPPENSARALRWSGIAEQWVKEGHAIDVVAGWQPDLALREDVNGVHVYRTRSAVLAPLITLLHKALGDGASGLPDVPPNAVDSPRLRTRVGLRAVLPGLAKQVHDRTWRTIRWPDYACLWFWPAFATAARLARRNQYDAVISVSLPFTSHLVGLALRRATGVYPWLVDIGDPWSFSPGYPMNNERLYRWLNRMAERNVLAACDSIAVTNPGALETFRELYPASAEKMSVVPPLLRSVAPDSTASMFPADGKMRLVFVGSLFGTIRSPAFLLEIFEELLRAPTPLAGRLELHLFGRVNDCLPTLQQHEALLGKSVFIHGSVPAQVARQAVSDADVLVNLGNLTTYQLPSKVAEYVTTGKPIVNVAYHERDSAKAFLEHYPAAITVVEASARAGKPYGPALLDFLDRLPHLGPEERALWRERFGVARVAGRYLDLLAAARAVAPPPVPPVLADGPSRP